MSYLETIKMRREENVGLERGKRLFNSQQMAGCTCAINPPTQFNLTGIKAD